MACTSRSSSGMSAGARRLRARPLQNLERVLSRQDNSASTYGALLQACGNARAVEQGSRIHQHLVSSGRFQRDMFLENHLVSMYGKCGSLKEAQEVFEGMARRNVVSWTAMVAAFAQLGLFEEALRHFMLMQLEGVAPNKVTFLAALKACDGGNLMALKIIHACIAELGLESDVVVASALVITYGRCQCFANAREVFDAVKQPDLILWNAVIAAHSGSPEDMLLLFRRMQHEGIGPDPATFSSVLNACSSPTQLWLGKLIHASIVESGYESDLIVGNALIDMYRNCESQEDAAKVFQRMQIKDVITWNSMMAASVECGCFEEVIQLYRQMRVENMLPDRITFGCVLSACGALMNLNEGREVHRYAVELSLDTEVAVGTALVNMYGKCGGLEEACETFDRMQQKDVATWTVMVAAYVDAGDYSRAFQSFQKMQLEGIRPNKVTFLAILDGCAFLSVQQARVIHTQAVAAGVTSDVTFCNSMINVFGKCQSVKDAELMFDEVQNRNLITWNSLMNVYSENQLGKRALQLYYRMQLEGIVLDRYNFVSSLNACSDENFGRLIHSNVLEAGLETHTIVQNALVSMYVKRGKLEEARRVFDATQEKNVITWTAMIDGYAQDDSSREAPLLFRKMLAEGVKPNEIALATITNWCARVGDLKNARLAEICVEDGGWEADLLVAKSLLNLYGKSGRLKQAMSLFDRMVERDAMSWNLVISSLAQHGYAVECLDFFQRMKQEGMLPDAVTFVNILAACSHAGLVDEGCEHFGYLITEYGIKPESEHLGCVVDLLGRAGRLAEARQFVSKMGGESNLHVWSSLLGACQAHQDTAEGKIVAEKLMELDPQNSAAYVILSNIYTASRQPDDAEKLRALMAQSA